MHNCKSFRFVFVNHVGSNHKGFCSSIPKTILFAVSVSLNLSCGTNFAWIKKWGKLLGLQLLTNSKGWEKD